MSLTFHASLNNNFNDISGNANDAIPTDVIWKSTRRGLKPSFNGTSSKLVVSDSPPLETIGGLSIAFWVKTSSLGDIIRKYDGAGTGAWAIWVRSTGAVHFRVSPDGTIEENIISNTDIRTNEFTHVCCVYDGSFLHIYINGVSDQTPVAYANGINDSDEDINVCRAFFVGWGNGILDDIRIYDNGLSAAEVLTLYNSTSAENGPEVAERSYQHDPLSAIPEQPGTVLSIGGKLPGDAVDTISDRALTNDATIFGAMPADDNYFIGGRRFDGVDDYLDCGNDSSLDIVSNLSVIAMFKSTTTLTNVVIAGKWGADASYIVGFSTTVGKVWGGISTGGSSKLVTSPDLYNDGEMHLVQLSYDSLNVILSIDGVIVGSIAAVGGVDVTTDDFNIARYSNNTGYHDCEIYYTCVGVSLEPVFNALAVVPVFELNFRDYPDNPGDTWTDNTLIPFSSGVVGTNGTFSVDGSQLICGEDTSTCTFRNNFKLDGQEYINVKINGIVYSGTGTITQGTVTVSIAQGSNKITIAANNGDVIDAIKIQFRETV